MRSFLHFRRWSATHRCMVIAALVLHPLASPAFAQLPTQLPGGLGSGQGGNLLGRLGGDTPGLPSVAQTGPANTAGVLQYCVQNNYLGNGAATSAKTALMGKFPQSNQNSSGFKQGSSGLLDMGNSQTFSLGGGGAGDSLKGKVTQKVCDMILQHAKSLL